ncbi:uncharacterized protein LOC141704307 [Apium graveolens]|uniref:uncharacterized protein LOC141704307 n=1 Tax=Apium graveolens TaxID=4045 RepID=UPI003D7BE4BC
MDANKMKGGSMGLSYPMLTKSNYTAWALKMRVFMQAHGVWEAIEPTDPKATIDERTDKIALAMIYQGIPEESLLSIADKKKAKDAWEAIKTLCQGADRVKKARIQTLKTEFESLQMKDNDQLDDFCMRLNGLVTNIRALGEEINESYMVKKLLRAAHEERLKGHTEGASSQLLLTNDEWAKKEKDECKLLLTREEWLKRTGKTGAESTGYMKGRGARDKSKIKCYNYNNYGHYAAECRKPRRTREVTQEV